MIPLLDLLADIAGLLILLSPLAIAVYVIVSAFRRKRLDRAGAPSIVKR